MEVTTVRDLHTKDPSTGEEKYRGPVRVKRVRDYSGGSLKDHIFRAHTVEELREIGAHIRGLVDQRLISYGTFRKLMAAGDAKVRELEGQLVVMPPTPQLVVPRPGRILLPGEA